MRAVEAHVDARHIETLDAAARSEAAPMADQRRAEFATGRACAHRAIHQLGRHGTVGRGARGEPVWPDGVTGSITHAARRVIAVVADRNASGRVVGIDLEERARLRPGLARRILTDREQVASRSFSEADATLRLASAFAIKEAFYKAHYQLDPRWLGFDAIEVDLDSPAGVRLRASGWNLDDHLVSAAEVGVVESDGFVLAAVSLIVPSQMS